MNSFKWLKAHCLRVALATSFLAPVMARCTLEPTPCFGQEAPDNGEVDDTGALETDPMGLDTDERKPHHRPSSEGIEGMPIMPYAGTIQRTDGMGDDQPLHWYRIQPKEGDARSVRCLKLTDQMVTCTE